MKRFVGCIVFIMAAGIAGHASEEQRAAAPVEKASLLVVVGTEGEENYGRVFAGAGKALVQAGETAQLRVHALGLDAKDDVLSHLKSMIAAEPPKGTEPLWLVLIGHGTVDGKEGKFNLRGADLTASELAAMLQPIQRPVVVIGAFSASGAFLVPLSAPKRVVVTATRSGGETNFAHFAEYFAQTIVDPTADLDHDGQTSLLEAWLSAARRVASFYESDGRLATEHSLLDDNGDGLGTPADWFSGIRVVKKTNDARAPDGVRAHQMHLAPNAADRALPPEWRERRDALELEIAALREKKTTLPEDEYYAKLEELFVRVARIYRDKAGNPPAAP